MEAAGSEEATVTCTFGAGVTSDSKGERGSPKRGSPGEPPHLWTYFILNKSDTFFI